MKRFSLYLIREILPLYLAGLAVLLVLLLAATLLGVLAEVIARGVSPALVARFLLYSLPGAASHGIPLALLFAALLGLARLGQDGEIKASLLLGIGPGQFLAPLVGLGLLISSLSFLNSELLVPWSTSRALEAKKDILIQSPELFLQEGSFFTDALGRSIFIHELKPGGLASGVTVIQAGGPTGPREVISAVEGQLDEAAGVWRLREVRFITYRQSEVVLVAEAAYAEVPFRRLAAAVGGSPELVRLPLRELLARLQHDRPQPAEWTALHRKFAEPAAATAFAIFALAIALSTFRSRSGLGLVSVLFLTFVYYATWSVFNLLGAQGTVPAWLAGWAPVALYAGSAAVLLAIAWRR